MKTILTLLFFSACLAPGIQAQHHAPDSISVTILLKNKKITVDSVFIIFDRYDLTGAGIIKQIFYPSDNKVVIEKVPKGKYYVDVFCIGVDRQSFTQISRIGKRRSNKVFIPFKTYEIYIPGTAIIPATVFDLSNLGVTKTKKYR
ncbi:MAG: hypothetical protein H7122_02885 [Chitinophagaceae bacterium]|nr:hypothetical protein [Chitinophagaceae bacterium]